MSYLDDCRAEVEKQYAETVLPSGSKGGCFGSILCDELHNGGVAKAGLNFTALAAKWGISVSLLGELIADHCKRLERNVKVNHEYGKSTYTTGPNAFYPAYPNTFYNPAYPDSMKISCHPSADMTIKLASEYCQ